MNSVLLTGLIKINIVHFRMVSSYLVHHGFSSTAEAFAKSTGQTFNEDIASIKNRQSMN